MASGNIIKLLLQSSADTSGFSKLMEAAKGALGDLGALSRASKTIGSAFGLLGASLGKFAGSLLQGGIWGTAAEGVKLLIDHFDLFGKKAKESAEKAKEANKEISDAAIKSYETIGRQAEVASAKIDKVAKAQQTLSDIFQRMAKAEMELERAEALRSGDLAKVQVIEAAMAEAERENAIDRANAEEVTAKKRVAARKNALEAAMKLERDAREREEEARKAAEAAKPRTVETIMQSSAGAFVLSRTVGSEADYRAKLDALENARREADAANSEIEKAKAAYDIEVEKWQLARENAKAVALEAKAAEEKAAAERSAAEKKEIDERNAAEEKRLREMHQRVAEEKRKAEIAAAKKAEEEKERIRRAAELKMLRDDYANNTARANDLKSKLAAAQADVAAAFDQFRNSDKMDQKAERRARRQEEIDKARLSDAAIDLQAKRKDWRTARNLSNREEAARRFLLAKENEQKQKNDLKDVVDKLGSIEQHLKEVSSL